MTFISKITPSGCFNMVASAVVVGAFSFSLVSAAEAAPARSTQEVGFSFSRSAPVEETYKDFQRTARRACDTSSPMGHLSRLRTAEKKCEAELLERAVVKAEIPGLTRHHADQVAPARRTTISSSN